MIVRSGKSYLKSVTVGENDSNDRRINILRIAKRVPVEHPRFAGENN